MAGEEIAGPIFCDKIKQLFQDMVAKPVFFSKPVSNQISDFKSGLNTDFRYQNRI